MFRIGIAEDDPSFQKTISEYIERYKKETNIDIQASFFQDGNELVFKYEPIYDVLLLDIEMPKMNGFDVITQFNPVPFKVIFTTAYDQYALKALRLNALDYLLKPIDEEEIAIALDKFKNKEIAITTEQVQNLHLFTNG